jgi:hypothetical protein
MDPIIDVALLQRAAVTYNNVLQTLPFNTLLDTCATLGIQLLPVTAKDIKLQFQRRGGTSGPYNPSVDPADYYPSEIGKIVQRPLDVLPCVNALKDHMMNYKQYNVISNAGEPVNHQTKKHPLERLILETVVTTQSEDMLLALFPGERDETQRSPLAMFDGIDTIIDTDISAGNISVARGNYIELGASPFTAPVDEDDVTALNNFIKFIRSLNSNLRKNAIVYVPSNVLFNVKDCLGNKKKAFLENQIFLQYVRDITNSPNLQIISHEVMGTGDRITATIPKNMDLGLNTQSAMQFVKVRDIYEDPNWLQFWSQWEAGFRISSVHQKTFAVSDGTPVADVSLSGDYNS